MLFQILKDKIKKKYQLKELANKTPTKNDK
jgi:hypothetical protein